MNPPILARLGRCPTQGGRVIPAVSARHSNGTAIFSINHPVRRDTCLRDKLCGVCEQRLADGTDDRIVIVVRPVDLIRGYTAEPALHPECSAYASRACPMLAGTMDHYRSTPRDLTAEHCGDPHCDCQLWTNSADLQTRAGAAASPFYAAWITGACYQLHHEPTTGHLLGLTVDQSALLKIRLICPGAGDVIDLTRIMLLGLPWHHSGTST
ncbi:hypothetical protein GCM10022226_61830 [Sphaerisporangium flaviroseum]|uniref:Uncharacterized protein n=1 Tax=Sphaerisporangium flaviroseum TaxID=509199 RepID=A0ABP7J2J8_9ACTN